MSQQQDAAQLKTSISDWKMFSKLTWTLLAGFWNSLADLAESLMKEMIMLPISGSNGQLGGDQTRLQEEFSGHQRSVSLLRPEWWGGGRPGGLGGLLYLGESLVTNWLN